MGLTWEFATALCTSDGVPWLLLPPCTASFEVGTACIAGVDVLVLVAGCSGGAIAEGTASGG